MSFDPISAIGAAAGVASLLRASKPPRRFEAGSGGEWKLPDFEICKPRLVPVPAYMGLGEQLQLVHLLDDEGNWKITPLKPIK